MIELEPTKTDSTEEVPDWVNKEPSGTDNFHEDKNVDISTPPVLPGFLET